jgi:DNA-binding NarL/FixJ family response regulator
MAAMRRAPIRIVLADNVQRVRDAVRDLVNLQTDMQVVGEADNSSTALALVAQLAPDLTLLDMRLPGADSLGLMADLRRVSPATALVLYMANPSAEAREAALRAGAAGFIEKGATPPVFLAALRQAATTP